MFRLLPILMMVLFCSCQSMQNKNGRQAMKEHDLYLKMKKATLVLLVNSKENGSAAFISEDGYIASASHCIRYRDDKIEVISAEFGRLPVKLVDINNRFFFVIVTQGIYIRVAVIQRIVNWPIHRISGS